MDSTAHALKFAGFQEMYFENKFPAEFEVVPKSDMINAPNLVHPKDLAKVPAPGKPLEGEDFRRFVARVSDEIAADLKLQRRKG